MVVGRVEQLWRYPVKSMRGERVSRAALERRFGIPGDRGWAIRDEDSGEIRAREEDRRVAHVRVGGISMNRRGQRARLWR